MKNKNFILLLLIIFATSIASCNFGSKKGKWSESDKEKYYKEMLSIDLSGFGESKDEWVDCYLKKLEANYTSFEEADNDEAGCEKYAEGCSDEIFGDMPEVKRWPEADRSRFYQEMESSDMSAFGDKKDEWVECYLSKLEANYASFLEADQDVAGCEKIAKECNDEVFK